MIRVAVIACLMLCVSMAAFAYSGDANELARINNTFGLKLFKQISAGKHEANPFVSPTSIASALQMVYRGADGTTKTAMTQALSLHGLSLNTLNSDSVALRDALHGRPEGPSISVVNSLWLKHGFTPRVPFLEAAQLYSGASIQPLTTDVPINNWVAASTNGKIKSIVSPADVAQARSVLVNAVYFRATWRKPFQARATADAPFHQDGGATETVKMMHQTDSFGYLKGEGFQAVRLPYEGGRWCMTILLPDTAAGMKDLLSRFTISNWNAWQTTFELNQGSVALPRFRTEFRLDLQEVLSRMGMEIAFTDRANFSLLSAEPLKIGKAIHKTFVEVNEAGTEAAAATGITMMPTAIRPPSANPFNMVMDRPFICIINDLTTGSILFEGLIEKPL